MTNPSRSNLYSMYTFTELCVTLNGEYHNSMAWREDRIIMLLEEISFRIREMKQLYELEKEIQKGVFDYNTRQIIPRDDD